jgi:hypothetical protein
MGVTNIMIIAVHQLSCHEYKINVLNMQVISLQCIIIIICIHDVTSVICSNMLYIKYEILYDFIVNSMGVKMYRSLVLKC